MSDDTNDKVAPKTPTDTPESTHQEPRENHYSPTTAPSTTPASSPEPILQTTPASLSTPSTTSAAPLKPKKKRKALIASLIGVLLLLVAGAIGGAYAMHYFSPESSPSLTTTNDGNAPVSDEERSIAAVAEKVGPSVVSIVTETRSRSYYGTTSGQAAGTGIIVSKDGYVMTNNHVLDSATNVSVVDSTGELYENVEIIGRDPLNDIAFLKISADKEFTAAQLGDSSTIRTGQQVVAIGNALGQYNNTVTSGIVSGTGRPITAGSESGETETLTDLIQTDASINPGNSGGPLVNMAGQVIGINTAIVEDANGIGFAIPVNATKGILAGVLETGKVTRSYLGVNYLTITPDVAREHDLSVNDGAFVYTSSDSNPVASGSPADRAGLKSGDILTKINNEVIGKQGSLSSILGEYRPGDKLTVTFLRDGREQTASLTLGEYKG